MCMCMCVCVCVCVLLMGEKSKVISQKSRRKCHIPSDLLSRALNQQRLHKITKHQKKKKKKTALLMTYYNTENDELSEICLFVDNGIIFR